ncbi:MAG: hypothetical protein FWD26_08785 [Treponema sp.]|nr:hypothetical protein [Treponema sp.]
MKQIYLSHEERHQLGYLQGSRIGRIEARREILIEYLYKMGREQNFIPSKKLIQKINRETDLEFLGGLLFSVFDEKLFVKELENCYDKLFLLPKKNENKKCFSRWPFDNEDAIILNELPGDE